MANEKQKDQNREEVGIPEKDLGKAKAKGAGASFGKSERDQEDMRRSVPESAGQGGGVQGTGQRNPTPNTSKTGQDANAGGRPKPRKGSDQDE